MQIITPNSLALARIVFNPIIEDSAPSPAYLFLKFKNIIYLNKQID